MLKCVAFFAVGFVVITTILKESFMARGSMEYAFVLQLGVPLIIFEMTFLGLITSLLLPMYFKKYGSVVFTSYGTMLKKGFDEAQT